MSRNLEGLQSQELCIRRILDIAEIIYKSQSRQLSVIYLNIPEHESEERMEGEKPLAILVDNRKKPYEILRTSNPNQKGMMTESDASVSLLNILRRELYKSMIEDLEKAIEESVKINDEWEKDSEKVKSGTFK